jgi:hypothetical protein
MERQGEEVHFETDEARGASTPNIVRWVLGISLVAAILLMSAIWIFGAASRVEGDDAAEARTRVLQEYGSQGGVPAAGSAEIEAAEPGDTSAPGEPPRVENEAADAPAAPEPAAT